MSRIVTKSTIQEWNDKSKINDMKHNKDLRTAVNPPKMVQFKKPSGSGRAERMQRQRNHNTTFDPSRLASILSGIPREGAEAGERRPPTPYKEYKDSIKKASTQVLSSFAGENTDNQESVRNKLANSKDIADILANRIGDLDLFQNEWIILCLTIGGKFLETRCGI